MADGIIVAWRNLVGIWRVPTVLVFELVQPIMFVLLFRFIYANAFPPETIPGGDYVMFLLPGIFVQNAIFGSTTTAIGLAEDLKKGLLDRFRSLPMAPWQQPVVDGGTGAQPPRIRSQISNISTMAANGWLCHALRIITSYRRILVWVQAHMHFASPIAMATCSSTAASRISKMARSMGRPSFHWSLRLSQS